jgi:RNA polymerase sigma-70 factor (ECF subfamily)
VTRPIALLSEHPATGVGQQPHEAAWTASYEAFVRKHGARLVQSLTLVALDPELAADAAQDAFLQLHLYWDKVQKYEDPVAWLYRVGVNRSKDYRRRLLRSARLFKRLVDASPPEPNRVEWEGRHEALAVFGPLPLRQRTAAALFYHSDFSVTEIAAVMDISEGTVKSHLSRARETLRKVLEAE